MVEAQALYGSGAVESSAASFAAAIRLIQRTKDMSDHDKAYLIAYCLAHFKNRPIRGDLKNVAVPEFPDLSKVARSISRQYPFKEENQI